MMNGTLKLGVMVGTTLLIITAVAWLLAEAIIFLTKDK
jgi:hypothetical protein